MATRNCSPDFIVSEYLEERAEDMAEVHEVFGEKVPWPKASSEAAPVQEPWERKRNFMIELGTYCRSLDKAFHLADGQFKINCSWDDVLQKLHEADNAVARRMERDRTAWAKGRAVLTDLTNLFEPAMQAIPDNLSFLHGGLALVLHLCRSRENVKADIVNVFDEVASTIIAAGSVAELVTNDGRNGRLNEVLDRLRLILFRAIPLLVDILAPVKLRDQLLAPVRSQLAARLLGEIRNAARWVNAQTQVLHNRHVARTTTFTKEQVKGIREGVLVLQEKYHGMNLLQEKIFDMVQHALASQNGMRQMLKEAVEKFYFFNSASEQGSPQRDAMRGSVSPTVSDDPINSPTSPVHSRKGSSSTGVPDPNKLVHLQLILGVREGIEIQDLSFVRRQEHEFDTKSKAAAAPVITHPNFLRWMANNQSDFLQIEGRLEQQHGKTSPISYFCAELVHELMVSWSGAAVAVYFFCGQHAHKKDPLRSPRGLMRSLITQLLRVRPAANLDGLDLTALDGDHESIHESIPMDHLCHLFQLLVSQFPSHQTVMCIIDDVSQFEKPGWESEYWDVMRMLWNIFSSETGEGPRFKVLLTTPGRSKWLSGGNELGHDKRVIVTDSGAVTMMRL